MSDNMLGRFSYSRWIDGFKGLLDSSRSVIGNTVVLPANAGPLPGGLGAPGVLTPILDMRGDDERAKIMSVVIEAEPQEVLPFGGAALGYSVRVFAELLWGVGGGQHRAEVDVVRGTMLSVFASSLQLRVAQETVQAAIVGPITIRARASAGYNPRGGPCAPTRTRYTNAIAPAANAVVAVPPYARSVSIYRAPAAAAYAVDFEDHEQAAGKVSCAMAVAANAEFPAHTPLANDTRWVRITAGGNLTDSRVIFDLSL